VSPGGEHLDELLGDLFLGKEHIEYGVSEEFGKVLQWERGCDPEHALPIEESVGWKDMAIWVEPLWKVAKGLDCDHGAGAN
jgi:hypothetical protein